MMQFNALPSEVMAQVFSHLKGKDFSHARLSCQTWNEVARATIEKITYKTCIESLEKLAETFPRLRSFESVSETPVNIIKTAGKCFKDQITDLSFNKLPSDSLHAFSNLKSLIVLEMFPDTVDLCQISQLTTLQELSLKFSNSAESSTGSGLEQLTTLKNLHTLKLSGQVFVSDQLINSFKKVTKISNSELMRSISNGNIDKIDSLLAAGSKVTLNACHDEKFLYFKYPIELAVFKGCIKITQKLLNAGASVKLPAKPFVAAKTIKHVELLAEYGADINAEVYGDTKLYFASRDLNLPLTRSLLQFGANPNLPGIVLPLYLVISRQNQEMTDLLLNYGADSFAVNTRGEPLLELCIELGQKGTQFIDRVLQKCREIFTEKEILIHYFYRALIEKNDEQAQIEAAKICRLMLADKQELDEKTKEQIIARCSKIISNKNHWLKPWEVEDVEKYLKELARELKYSSFLNFFRDEKRVLINYFGYLSHENVAINLRKDTFSDVYERFRMHPKAEKHYLTGYEIQPRHCKVESHELVRKCFPKGDILLNLMPTKDETDLD